MKSNRHLRLSSVLPLIALFALPSAIAGADRDEDVFKAQRCFNKTPQLGCINPILRYDDPYVNELKCAIRLYDQGLTSIFRFPWAFSGSGGENWEMVLRSISNKNLTRADASQIRYDCSNSLAGSRPVNSILGEHFWLRAVLIEVSPIRQKAMIDELGVLNDGESTVAIARSYRAIYELCTRLKPKAPARKFIICEEALKLPQRSGANDFERFVDGLQSP